MSEADGMERPVRPAPRLERTAHKGSAGRLLCFAGSGWMPGAAILVVRAAQRAGAGLVTLASFGRELVRTVAPASPETIYLDLSGVGESLEKGWRTLMAEREDQVRVAGPGLGRTPRTDDLVWQLVEDDFKGPTVFDADALYAVGTDLGTFARRGGPTVLTPHPGEAARLLGENRLPDDDEGRLAAALEIARSAGSICGLKGHRTVVTDGTRVYVNETGNPGMGTAGAGDVLVGILGAYLCSAVGQASEGWGVFEAVATSVHLHGLAGDLAAETLGERAVIATSLIDFLAGAERRLRAGRSQG